MRHLSLLAVVVSVALLASPAFAQDLPATKTNPEDYRWAIYTSCTVVFAILVLFLVLTRMKSADTSRELAAIERRLDELEKGQAS